MVQQASEVRMSTQMGATPAEDFADRTGGAPSHEDVGDLYQMRPQIQHSSQNQLDMSRHENLKPLMTPSQEKEPNSAVLRGDELRQQSASQAGAATGAQVSSVLLAQQRQPGEGSPHSPTLEPRDESGAKDDTGEL